MKTHMTVDQQIATVVELQNFIEGLPKSLSVIFMTDTQDLQLKIQHKLNPAIQISSDTLNPAWLKAFLMGVMTNPEWH